MLRCIRLSACNIYTGYTSNIQTSYFTLNLKPGIMKKALIFLIALSLFTACKNDKSTKDNSNRAKDDYRDSDKNTKSDDKEKTTTDYTEDKNDDDTKTENDDNSKDQGDFSGGGWPQVERTAFIKSCEREAMAKGQTRLVAESYCECMLDKIESAYPDIRDAAKITEADVERIGMKYKDKCLEEH